VIRGHAFIQNLRRGHYELGVNALPGLTVAAAFDELALAVVVANRTGVPRTAPANRLTQQSRHAPVSLSPSLGGNPQVNRHG
jgi:hypothetical protein